MQTKQTINTDYDDDGDEARDDNIDEKTTTQKPHNKNHKQPDLIGMKNEIKVQAWE